MEHLLLLLITVLSIATTLALDNGLGLHRADDTVMAQMSQVVTDAALVNDLATLRQALELGASAEGAAPTATRRLQPRTALLAAAFAGHAAACTELAAHGAHLEARDAKGLTSLSVAASRGHRDCVAALLAAGADANADAGEGLTPLGFAVDRGDATVVRLLLEQGVEPAAALALSESAQMTSLLLSRMPPPPTKRRAGREEEPAETLVERELR